MLALGNGDENAELFEGHAIVQMDRTYLASFCDGENKILLPKVAELEDYFMLDACHRKILLLWPGLVLSFTVTAGALFLERVETLLLGRAWIESIVFAILIGTVVRSLWMPGARFQSGIKFSAKFLLEIAIVLLGASISAAAIAAKGLVLVAGIALVVAFAIIASFGICRAFGLSHKMAVLVACGNSICGNSAIAAVAPVIGADNEDIAASIAFTAVLGVIVVLSLPLVIPALGLSAGQYGVLAGLTVYAVPQVIAATAPVATLSAQVGTLVKLVRVLMLGPVVLILALLSGTSGGKRPSVYQLVPWFIIGFLMMMGLRSMGLIPQSVLNVTTDCATVLTILAMAGLGLGVDVKAVTGVGPRVTAAVILSLAVLGAVSISFIRLTGVA
jgi:uncharacterized integral membrane protein (TIGR00698 family)